MIAVAAILAGLGIAGIISKRTLFGVLIGVHLLLLGAAMIFVMVGADPNPAAGAGTHLKGHAVGLFVTLSGVVQLVAGFGLAVRFYYLKNSVEMRELKGLKH